MSKKHIDKLLEDAKEPVDDTALAALPRNDLGNAQRFCARHGRDVRFTQRLGGFAWNGKYWQRDDGEVLVRSKAQATAVAIKNFELPAFEDSITHLDKRERETKKESFAKFAIGCAQHGAA